MCFQNFDASAYGHAPLLASGITAANTHKCHDVITGTEDPAGTEDPDTRASGVRELNRTREAGDHYLAQPISD